MLKRACVAGIISAALASSGDAFADSGVVEVTDCFSGSLQPITAVGDTFYAAWSHAGVRRAKTPGGPFDGMSGRCVGFVWRNGEGMHGRSGCEFVDAQGDRVFIENQREGDSGVWKFVGGTGKYLGLTGNGEYLDWGYFPRLDDETYQQCPVSRGRYEIPKKP